MNIIIPPIFFYVIGAILVIAGVVRAATLGRRNADRELVDDTPERAKARRRHLTFGIVWVAMGLFLLFSTAGLLRLRH